MSVGVRRQELNRRTVALSLGALLFAFFSPITEAQQPSKIPRIGYLTGTREPTSDAPDANRDAFRQGLRDLGYVEGKIFRLSTATLRLHRSVPLPLLLQ